MKRKIVLPTLLVVFLILALASTAAAHPAFPAELPLPDGFFPEGIVVGRGTNFYTGSLLDGAIYRGDLRTGEMIAMSDPTGQMAVGLAHDPRTNFVYAASGQGTTGRVAIFDGETMELVDNVTLSEAAGFVNDVTVTGDGAYLTDSFTHVLYRLPLDPETGIPDPAGVTTIPLGGDFQPEAGFNANGIVATANGRWLIVVNSASGTLYRVDPSSGVATAVDLGSATVVSGDGLVLSGNTLYVVQNAAQQVSVFQMRADFSRGLAGGVIPLPDSETPTTADLFGSHLYVVDARFVTGPGPDVEYSVVAVDK
jgi:sugar lactone lactonase YvrE